MEEEPGYLLSKFRAADFLLNDLRKA